MGCGLFRFRRVGAFLVGALIAVYASTGGLAIEHQERFVCHEHKAIAKSIRLDVLLEGQSQESGVPLLYCRRETTGPFRLELRFTAEADCVFDEVEVREVHLRTDRGAVSRFPEADFPMHLTLGRADATNATTASVVLPDRLELSAEEAEWCSVTLRLTLRGRRDASILVLTRTLVPECEGGARTGWQQWRASRKQQDRSAAGGGLVWPGSPPGW